MSKLLNTARYPKKAGSALDIKSFLGLDATRLCDGILLDAKNVTVASGGALVSLPRAEEIDTSGGGMLRDGVYTLCEDCDREYETPVSREWIYKNVFPKSVREYSDGECSRLLIKGIGMPPKNENGYRNIKGTFYDGERLFIFYEACYNIIDNYRAGIFEAVGSALSWRFYSGNETFGGSKVNIYTLTQLWLDVIEGDRVESSLVDAKLSLVRGITDTKYKWSRLISEDRVNYKYTSSTYVPIVGENYTAYIDYVYTELYGGLENERAVIEPFCEKSVIKYSNLENGGDIFSAEGEKLLVMPDRRLLVQNGGYRLSDEVCESMPPLTQAVQLYDRLYGIYENKLCVSNRGSCTEFDTDSFETVTADAGGFTAIAAVSGKAVVFTADSMLTVKGSEMPFTLSHEADVGCAFGGAAAAVSGKLYFVFANGIFCTGGGTVKCISGGFPLDIDYSMVKLSSACGMLVASVGTLDEIWVYNPLSDAWSTLSLGGDVHSLVGDFAIVRASDGYAVHRLFAKEGEFEFSVGLVNRGRKRIKSAAFTASVAPNASLALLGSGGKVLGEIYAPSEELVTKEISLRREYIDHGVLHFGGYGAVTLYGIRCEI